MKILIATNNSHKFKEISQILSVLNVKLLSLSDFPDIGEIHETGNSFSENAKIKAMTVNKLTGHITLADDSGLEIEALGNEPGINSARYLGKNTDYRIKNKKILEILKSVPDSNRQARFICTVAICFDISDCEVTTGKCEGFIAREIKGEQGFGYDPIFWVPEYKKTFAELDDKIKNTISHRAIALNKAINILNRRKEKKNELVKSMFFNF